MEKFSVQKPFTVLVAVIMIIALGWVTLNSLTADLLPQMSFPYLMIITVYPGANPERVAADVTGPLENALGVVKNVRNVSSQSSENYSLVNVEFADGTNMDSAMVNVSSTVNQVAAGFPSGAGTPTILELGMDMVATMYVAVSREGDDIYALSDYVNDTVLPAFQKQNGVANVTAVGLVEKTVRVELNPDKIDALNQRILEQADSALLEAREALDEAKKQVDEGQAELERRQAGFGALLAGTLFDRLDEPVAELTVRLRDGVDNLNVRLTELGDRLDGMGESEEASLVRQAVEELDALMLDLEEDFSDTRDLSERALALLDKLKSTADTVSNAFNTAMRDAGADGVRAQDALRRYMTAVQDLTRGLNALIDALRGVENAPSVQAALAAVNAVLPEVRRSFRALREELRKLEETLGAGTEAAESNWSSGSGDADAERLERSLREAAGAMTEMISTLQALLEQAGVPEDLTALTEELRRQEQRCLEALEEALRQEGIDAQTARDLLTAYETAQETLEQLLQAMRDGDTEAAAARLPQALEESLAAAQALRDAAERLLASVNAAAAAADTEALRADLNALSRDLTAVLASLDTVIPLIRSALENGVTAGEDAGALLADLRAAGQAAVEAMRRVQERNATDYSAIARELRDFRQASDALFAALEEYAKALSEGLDSAQVRAAASRLLASLNGVIYAFQGSRGSLLGYLNALSAGMEAGQDALRETLRQNRLREELNALRSDLRTLADRLTGTTLSDLMRLTSTMERIVSRTEELLDGLDADLSSASGDAAEAMDRAREALENLKTQSDRVPELLDTLETAYAGLTQGQLEAAVAFSLASQQLTSAQAQLASAFDQYEKAREQALSSANVDMLVDASTLSSLIYAQNFAMPAGYIDDADGESWLLRVGDEFGSEQEIAQALLSDIDGIGTIRIADIADITVTDNAGETYANLSGGNGIMLCIYKSSTAGTNDVSKACDKAIAELLEADESLSLVKLLDQGIYITLIIRNILQSMILGAALAIAVLALFLKDVRPTLIVGISIPLSVLFALVLMYFTGLSLNMMTLSGLGLGIGMLVDNSIVVMENILRLRVRGMSAPRAAVQGTKQVTGSILASTLTTVSVFLPMVFSTGTVRELLIPLSLSVSYCLAASFLVAVTVIPASASTILAGVAPKPNRTMERVQRTYAGVLRWLLGHKGVAIGVSLLLLAGAVLRLFTMGIVVLPKMAGTTTSITITTDPEYDRETSYRKLDEVMERLLTVNGVEEVGIMDQGSVISSVGALNQSGTYGSYICFVILPEDMGSKEIDAAKAEMEEKTRDLTGCELDIGSGGMMDMSALTASGITVNIYGEDETVLRDIASRVAGVIRDTDGFAEVTDGGEDAQSALHLVIDRDKAMSCGLTVAQIYMEIASRLNTSVTGTAISAGGFQMDVTVEDPTDPLTRENLLDMEFSASGSMSASGGDMSSMMGSGMSSMMGGDMSSMMGSGMSSMIEMFAGGADSAAADDGGGAEDAPAEPEVHKLREFAHLEETVSSSSIQRENLSRYLSVTAATADGYNATLLTRSIQGELDGIRAELPKGYSIEVGGESEEVNEMIFSMLQLAGLGLLFIYLVMVAQFQSLLSPFIILFTVPLAFTGGMIGLIVAGQQLSMLSIMGFLILMGTVVNNGIVFVDYTNQLRLGGLEKWDALIASGQARMRPILMTTLTTVLAMTQLAFSDDLAGQLGGGMAIVIIGGLVYATLMTLFVIPVMYDILYRRQPKLVDVGSDVDEVPDDAAEYLEQLRASALQKAQEAGQTPEPEMERQPETEQSSVQEDQPVSPASRPS